MERRDKEGTNAKWRSGDVCCSDRAVISFISESYPSFPRDLFGMNTNATEGSATSFLFLLLCFYHTVASWSWRRTNDRLKSLCTNQVQRWSN